MPYVNLQDFEKIAKEKLPKEHFDFIAGGAEDGITTKENKNYYQKVYFLPKVLRGISKVDTSTSILSKKIPLPILLAPMAFHELVHKDGELATARAAQSSGIPFIISTMSSKKIEDIQEIDKLKLNWFQLYVFKDRNISRKLIERAEAAGCSALVLTVDVPIMGRRELDIRNAFKLPCHIHPANFEMQQKENLSVTIPGSAVAQFTSAAFEPALSWEDIDWIQKITTLPIYLKGVLHPDDAVTAKSHGISGLILSNHGGRQLDTMAHPLITLPIIRENVGKNFPLFIDGGITRGTDIVKAIAMGADAVLIGRPVLFSLACEGENGLKKMFHLLQEELIAAMQLCGFNTINKIKNYGKDLVIPNDILSLQIENQKLSQKLKKLEKKSINATENVHSDSARKIGMFIPSKL